MVCQVLKAQKQQGDEKEGTVNEDEDEQYSKVERKKEEEKKN